MVCSNCGTDNKETARFCKYCGSKLNLKRTCPACGNIAGENAKFCKKCGTKLLNDSYKNAAPNTGAGQSQQHLHQHTAAYNTYNSYRAANNGFSENDLPVQYRPLSAWAYFGWSMLFTCVPFGWIVAIVFAVGKTDNINLRNFARSMFCFLVVIGIILLLFIGGMGCTVGMMI